MSDLDMDRVLQEGEKILSSGKRSRGGRIPELAWNSILSSTVDHSITLIKK